MLMRFGTQISTGCALCSNGEPVAVAKLGEVRKCCHDGMDGDERSGVLRYVKLPLQWHACAFCFSVRPHKRLGLINSASCEVGPKPRTGL